MRFKAGAILILATAMLTASSVAFAQDAPVLSQFKVVQENGKEVLKPVSSVSKGEIVEYRAEFVNHHSEGAMTDVILDIPIPAGSVVMLSSIQPKQGATATADGKNFGPVPLKNKVQRGAALIEETVPLENYKAVRWSIPVLQPGAKADVSVRVRIR